MKTEIIKHEWNEAAASVLRPAFGDDENIIRAQVESGICELFEVPGAGWFITRVEVYPDYKELVVVALAGKNMLYLLQIAKKIQESGNVKRVRIHPINKKFYNVLERVGFVEVERVFSYG